MNPNETVNIRGKTSDDILDAGGEVLPVGVYTVRASKCEPKEGEGENPSWVELTWQVLQGESEGLTMTWYIFPSVTARNGRLRSRGFAAARAACAAIGKPFKVPLDEFYPKCTLRGARLLVKTLADRFRNERVTIQVVEEQVVTKDEKTQKWVNARNDDGSLKKRRVPVVLGLAAGAQANPEAETATGGAESEDEDSLSLL